MTYKAGNGLGESIAFSVCTYFRWPQLDQSKHISSGKGVQPQSTLYTPATSRLHFHRIHTAIQPPLPIPQPYRSKESPPSHFLLPTPPPLLHHSKATPPICPLPPNNSKIPHPCPPQNPLQLPPHLPSPSVPGSTSHLPPPPRPQLHKPLQDRAVDDITADARVHARQRSARQRQPVRPWVEPGGVRQRRHQLRGERREATVRRLGKRAEGGEDAGCGGEEERVRGVVFVGAVSSGGDGEEKGAGGVVGAGVE